MSQVVHQPALLHQTIDGLKVKAGKNYLDATIGSAGHAVEIAKLGGRVYGLDVDPEALKQAKARLSRVPGAEFQLLKANFSQLKQAAQRLGVDRFAGVLFDLGLSSEQLADQARGFSFQQEGPLDMRADPELRVTAADLVNGLNQGELKELFTKYGEEPWASRIAQNIVKVRKLKPIYTTGQLADIVSHSIRGARGRIHPATRVFQALRIAVNDELNNLKSALPQAVELLETAGRLAVISFHSLEDRIVKNFMKSRSDLKILSKKPIRPETDELEANPRSRSAKLRLAEKL